MVWGDFSSVFFTLLAAIPTAAIFTAGFKWWIGRQDRLRAEAGGSNLQVKAAEKIGDPPILVRYAMLKVTNWAGRPLHMQKAQSGDQFFPRRVQRSASSKAPLAVCP